MKPTLDELIEYAKAPVIDFDGEKESIGYQLHIGIVKALQRLKELDATVKEPLTVQRPPYNRGIPTVEEVPDDVEIWVFAGDGGFVHPHWALTTAFTLRSWAKTGLYRNAPWLPINAIPLPKE